jgi:cysteine synthase A
VGIIATPMDYNESDLFIDLCDLVPGSLFLKCEGFNFAGSIKLKTATAMVDAAERDGLLSPGSVLVESSSGNLGVALSVIARNRGYRFVCITDSRCNLPTRRLMEALGAEVIVATDASGPGGLLGARLRLLHAMRAADPRVVWLNQYANPANWQAHTATTGPEIEKWFPDLDVLFVGAGTTGTLMGCARYFRENGHRVTVVAIDAEGSVTFGAPAAARAIPGLGTGVRPDLLDPDLVDDVVHVSEVDTVAACRSLAGRGFLLGGSTGTVLSGAIRWLDANDARRNLISVAISPDCGERYLGSVYDDDWVAANIGGSG